MCVCVCTCMRAGLHTVCSLGVHDARYAMPLPAQVAYESQFGEDQWLVENLLWNKRNGFYLEMVRGTTAPTCPGKGESLACCCMRCLCRLCLEHQHPLPAARCLLQGAMDGLTISNTIWLARAANWTGMLIEACPGRAGG